MLFGGFNTFSLIDFPGKIASMVYTIGCNFRCPYCHNPELVDETVEEKIDESQVLSFMAKRHDKLHGIVITGGEPTIHGQDLLNFMKRIKNLKFLVKLDTNGTNPDFIRKAISENLVDYLAMDIKAPLEDYDRIVGRPVDTEKIRESIDILIQGEIEYEFRTTILKALLSEKDVEKVAKEISGAKRYYLQKFIPTKILNPQFKRKVCYEDKEILRLREIASKHVKNCYVR